MTRVRRFMWVVGGHLFLLLVVLGLQCAVFWSAFFLFWQSLEVEPRLGATLGLLGILLGACSIMLLPTTWLIGLKRATSGIVHEFQLLFSPQGEGEDVDVRRK